MLQLASQYGVRHTKLTVLKQKHWVSLLPNTAHMDAAYKKKKKSKHNTYTTTEFIYSQYLRLTHKQNEANASVMTS